MPPRFSVVIPTYQRRESLLRTLASLRRQTVAPETYEVIVSVDGSTDGTAEAVRGYAAPYASSVLVQPRRGRARARNAGIRAAVGDVIVLLDDDMEPALAFLESHGLAHEKPGTWVVIGAAPIVVSSDSPPFMRYMAAGFEARLERLGQPGFRLGFRDAYTGNLSCRRDVLLGIGGFDEAFRVYGHEDYELALRLQDAGAELTYSAGALAHQHYDKTFRDFAGDGIARGRTAVLFADKHPAVADRLALSEYRRGDWRWRALRGLLLGLGRVTDRVPEWVVEVVEWLERQEPARLDKYYTLAIDYLFWYGALRARRDRRFDRPAARSAGGSSASTGVGAR
jgi:glycosyltransferase involved in cell wall biosynthesis